MKPIITITAALFLLSAVGARAASAPTCMAKPILHGYGANGPYGGDMKPLANPADPADQMAVFLPKGAPGPRPVVFFAHGFGPGRIDTYRDFIGHMVSKGDIVVFSSYPMRGVTIDQRYNSLWRGFQFAAATFRDQMDLSRVAFIGHSFGGGAVPAMAYRGLVQDGWGKKAAFLMELAPWYSYGIKTSQMAAIPASAADFVEVYADDTVNDHRMAIDLYTSIPASDRYYALVKSDSACGFIANHATPGRNSALIQKQYALFWPFDALSDALFNGNPAGGVALAHIDEARSGYAPLRLIANPTPDQPQSHYRWGWTNGRNPREQAEPAFARPAP